MGRPIAGTLLVSSLGLGRLRWSPSGLSEKLGSKLGQFFWSSLSGQARRGFICVQWLVLEWKTWDLAQTPLSPLLWALSLQRRGVIRRCRRLSCEGQDFPVGQSQGSILSLPCGWCPSRAIEPNIETGTLMELVPCLCALHCSTGFLCHAELQAAPEGPAVLPGQISTAHISLQDVWRRLSVGRRHEEVGSQESAGLQVEWDLGAGCRVQDLQALPSSRWILLG